jgi:hypothetical protein
MRLLLVATYYNSTIHLCALYNHSVDKLMLRLDTKNSGNGSSLLHRAWFTNNK